jgi:hypothetical protein
MQKISGSNEYEELHLSSTRATPKCCNMVLRDSPVTGESNVLPRDMLPVAEPPIIEEEEGMVEKGGYLLGDMGDFVVALCPGVDTKDAASSATTI